MRLKNRSLFKPQAKREHKIEAKGDETNVYLYDEISWLGIQTDVFVRDLNEIKSKTIHLHINSPGGSVFDGVTIYNAIRQHKAKFITHIDGLAASIASIIAIAGDEVRISKNAFFMIHEPYSMVIGGAEELRKEADLIDKVAGTIVSTYATKTGKTEDEIREWMRAETWFTGDEAVENGFADAIDETDKDKKMQVQLFDLSAFANVPDALLTGQKAEPTVRETERLLRDAGFSDKRAKEILSKGFADEGKRDVSPEPEKPKERDVPRDKVAELLARAELVAPTINDDEAA
jgi:ATP-dependent Clp protease protease subunit